MIPSDDVRQNALPGLSGPVGSPALGEMLSRVELDIRRIEPQNPQLNLDTVLRDLGVLAGSSFYQLRIERAAQPSFLCHSHPRALAIASAIYVIVDLDRPFDGIFSVSSQPLRER
jgi:hypothetical protein